MRTLTSDEHQHYREHGYVVVAGVLDLAEANRLDAEIEQLLSHQDGEAPPGWVFGLHQQESAYCAELAQDERILGLVSQVVSPGVALHSSKLVAKLPHDDAVCHWHQDESFYLQDQEPEMHSDVRMSIWIPLTEVTEANGCLWIVPDSHRAGVESHQEVGTGHCRRQILRHEWADDHAIAVEMKAGDALLFSSFLWHHSRGNTTDTVRRAFIVSYQEATVPRDGYGKPTTVLQVPA